MKMTRVFAINGSPRMDKGNTAMVLSPFLEGMKRAGAEIDLVYSKKLNIKSCIGDFQCWYRKVGECIHSDEMKEYLERLRIADIFLIATPIYLPLPGELQDFLNRLMPLVEPILDFRKGRTRAKFHDDVKISKIVLVSTGGWWEKENFDTVVRIAREIAENGSVEFVDPILRPHAFLMENDEQKTKEIIDAAEKAGYQLIKDGEIPIKLLNLISQPLIPEEELRKRYNESYESAK
jgi:multimeric flavodoxin WrbA